MYLHLTIRKQLEGEFSLSDFTFGRFLKLKTIRCNSTHTPPKKKKLKPRFTFTIPLLLKPTTPQKTRKILWRTAAETSQNRIPRPWWKPWRITFHSSSFLRGKTFVENERIDFFPWKIPMVGSFRCISLLEIVFFCSGTCYVSVRGCKICQGLGCFVRWRWCNFQPWKSTIKSIVLNGKDLIMSKGFILSTLPG